MLLKIKAIVEIHAGLRCLGNSSDDETDGSMIFCSGTTMKTKGNPTEVSNLHPPTLPFATSNQFQRLSSSNLWRFGCLPSGKSSKPDCMGLLLLTETSPRR